MFPLVLVLLTEEITSLSILQETYSVVWSNSRQIDGINESKFLEFDEFDPFPIQKPLVWHRDEQIPKKVHVVSVFGEIHSGKSRILYEFMRDSNIFSQKKKNMSLIEHEGNPEGTTRDVLCYDVDTTSNVREKYDVQAVKCLDVEGTGYGVHSLRRKRFVQMYAHFMYSVSDIVLVVCNASTCKHTLDLLFESVSHIELREKPELFLILNNELEKNSDLSSLSLKDLRIPQFSRYKFIWIPSCLTDPLIFREKVASLNQEIIESLGYQNSVKKNSVFNGHTWYDFADRILKTPELEVYDIVDEFVLTTNRIISEIFYSYFTNGKISFFSAIVVCCKYFAIKKEISFIERKKTIEFFMKRIPKVLNYSNFNMDLVYILDHFHRIHFTESMEETVASLVSLTNAKKSLKEILNGMDQESTLLKNWRISEQEAISLFPANFRPIQSDSWCPLCFENYCSVFYYKCKHLICQDCDKKVCTLGYINKCVICLKEIQSRVNYALIDDSTVKSWVESDLKGKRIISVMGDVPNQIKSLEPVSALIKMIKNPKFTLISDSNYVYLYVPVSLNTREQAEVMNIKFT